MIVLIEKTIEDVQFRVVMNTEMHYFKLYVDSGIFFIQDIDLAQIIRAVEKSETIYDFRLEIRNVIGEEILLHILRGVVGLEE